MTEHFPVCLHKHDEWFEITRMCDPFHVWMGPCGGVRTEAFS